MDLETEKTREKFEADELDEMRNRSSAGAFVMDIQSEWRHCRRERHERDRYAVVQTWHEHRRVSR